MRAAPLRSLKACMTVPTHAFRAGQARAELSDLRTPVRFGYLIILRAESAICSRLPSVVKGVPGTGQATGVPGRDRGACARWSPDRLGSRRPGHRCRRLGNAARARLRALSSGQADGFASADVACRVMTETPEGLDISRPNVARVYDYWLDGKDNFAADRELAESMLAIFPGLRELVRANRQFIARAVSWVAGQGIDQFIDAGAGLPTTPSTHESAQAVSPLAKVAYVDNDPVVISHARALLAGRDDRVSVTRGDLRDPAAVLEGCTSLDTGKPLCLILAAVLHLMDAESARRVARDYVSRLPRGSYVIITLARYDDPVLGDQIMGAYSAASFFNHSWDDAATFFAGLELIEPGLASGSTWRGGTPGPGLPDGAVYPLAGVARKPLRADRPRLLSRPGRCPARRTAALAPRGTPLSIRPNWRRAPAGRRSPAAYAATGRSLACHRDGVQVAPVVRMKRLVDDGPRRYTHERDLVKLVRD